MEPSPVQQDGKGGGDCLWEEDDSELKHIFESENIPESSNNRLFLLMEQNQKEEEELEKEIKTAETGIDSFLTFSSSWNVRCPEISGVRICNVYEVLEWPSISNTLFENFSSHLGSSIYDVT